MKYESYRYIYPPRPKNAIPPTDLNFWDNGTLICQPKLNGSNCLIFINGDKIFVMNRHSQNLTNFEISRFELGVLNKCEPGKWIVLNGEYLNKSKRDEVGDIFNHKLVIFDILVYNSEYLISSTFQDRINLLDKLFGKSQSEKSYLYSISENIYRVKSYDSQFYELFEEFTKTDMLEGVVLKRKSAKLELGNTENNNTKSQLKSRKPTKNYKF